jgi:Arc/MetJ-type ribon-helix-helix transcriptional regulator
MVTTDRITIRLPSDKLTVLQSLVDSGEFDNLSDAVRAAVDAFVNARFTPENIAKITVDLPKGNVVALESLVKDGDSVSLDDAIRNAVREYTRTRLQGQNGQK